ncbi:MAG: hypothetical protein IJS61_00805 [Firmicutes bacterium]|nr:hypothetical protein [Bacillota bacterium]
MTTINRAHKDRLFRAIFGREENKKLTLELYNAVNNSHYTNADDIQLTIIEDVIYMGMKNDVSFIIGDTLNLYEQQSSINPNMPLRFLEYVGMVYSKYVEENANFNIYSYKLQKIPTPKFVCFYNGVDKTADRKILRLSEAYNGEGDVEVKVLMLNINYGHNKELLNICKPLSDYAWFVERIRYNQKITDNIEMAVDQAIEEMDEASQVKEFILANKAEVRRMCITEYDETKVLAALKEESREEGRAEGILDTLIDLVKKGLLSVSNAATQAGMSVSEFELKSGLKA